MTNRLNSVVNARQVLGRISQETFYKYVRTGDLRVVKLGRRTFVTDAEA